MVSHPLRGKRISFRSSQAVTWFKNPGPASKEYWEEYLIYPHFGNETPLFVDVDGDGRCDLIGNDPIKEEVIWLRSPTEKGETSWEKYVISDLKGLATYKYTHGLGFGDLNGDGRNDVIVTNGWWEMPPTPTQPNWKFHVAELGRDAAQMYVFDVNRDDRPDVVSSSAHNYGIWWHRQQIDPVGQLSWSQHEIYTGFSQSHALAFEDINGDGKRDLISGKRYYAHLEGDPGSDESAVLYWFQQVERDGASSWIPHLIDDDSGVGYQIVVTDINGDGLQDIVTANKKGVFVFYQTN